MAGNSLQAVRQQSQGEDKKPQGKFSQWIQKVENKNAVVGVIGDQTEAQKFIGNLSSAVVTNPELQKCDFNTVVSAGLLANALKLSMTPAIGHCYILPFEDKKNQRFVATFVLGWKGYVQLAERSGYYEKINVVAIKEGEIVKIDTINDEYIFKPIEDDEIREKKETVGYYAFFQYDENHGRFKKALYWSKKKMLQHADRYSPAFHLEAVKSDNPARSRVSYADFCAGKFPKNEAWKYSSFWYTDFDGMAMKTMIRQLIGKWGIMSIDFARAVAADNSYIEGMGDDAAVISVDGGNDMSDSPIATPASEIAEGGDDEGGEPSPEEIAEAEEAIRNADEDGVVPPVQGQKGRIGRRKTDGDSAAARAALFGDDKK